MKLFSVEVKCPKCGSERIQARTRADDYVEGRTWFEISCLSCGHNLSYEEIGRQVGKQMLESSDQPSE